jgi:NRE family putative nickel resistance protein-like MFS transporter
MPAPFVHRTASVFGTLRNRELRAFWLSDWVSDAGSFVTFIALAVYVNQLTGSPAAVGLALALRSIPWFTFGPFAGVLADRLDRRSVMFLSNLARAVLVALLPFTKTVWLIYVIAFASACFAPLFRSARSALLPLIAPERQLVPALAVLETTHQTLHTVGPAFGGLVVLLVGARWAFFVDAASFVGATMFLFAIPRRGRSKGPRRAIRHDLADGVRRLFATPPALAWVLLEVPLALGSSLGNGRVEPGHRQPRRPALQGAVGHGVGAQPGRVHRRPGQPLVPGAAADRVRVGSGGSGHRDPHDGHARRVVAR